MHTGASEPWWSQTRLPPEKSQFESRPDLKWKSLFLLDVGFQFRES